MTVLISNLRQQADSLRQRWGHSAPRRWLYAWCAELVGLLPGAVRARMAPGPARQRLVWPLPPGVDSTRPATLLLPASLVLVQRLELPAAAAGNLHAVVGFEIDRYTPFTAEQVHYAVRLLERDATRARVLLVAIGRERLSAILEHCQGLGLQVHSLRALDESGQLLPGELLALERRSAGAATRLLRAAMVLALALLIALLASLLEQRQVAVEQMSAQVAEQRRQVAQLQTVRRELTDSRDAAGYLSRLKAAMPTTSQLLGELTECLGDDSWLEQLQVRDSGELSVAGQSRHASALLNHARGCAHLQAVQFQGVIQPDGQTGNDRFALVARIRQEAADAPTAQTP
ncbi:type II secretion system protein GspL [Pseudomonas sp. HR96]|uniref:type II secretion system protein GspL n=1 Tax=Pseudomonas sp. HR96 TaxID=1027966 RepID=UPI002A74D9C7|nr:type II secretion system protein GspL [Pseudomonas sp. HR96]WPO98446.1 type II secretion system protein GspL [Pseudomonas sp. HR96]